MSLNPAFAPENRSLTSLPPVRTDSLSRESLLKYFRNTWELYETLFSSIQNDEALYVNPDPLRHPLIFYLGHTAAFYVNKLVISGLLPDSRRINPAFERLFEQGVDPGRSEDLGSEAWPSVDEVRVFRSEVYELVYDFINSHDYDDSLDANHQFWSLLMGLEHDRIHFETSSVLIRQYPVDQVSRPANWIYAPVDHPVTDNQWLQVPSTVVSLGKPADFPTFGWDNEYGNLDLEIPAFEATQNLVTNAEFLAFLRDGGYRTDAFWTAEGWAWRKQFDIRHPRFWVEAPDGYRYRAMFDEMEIPMAWPVEVTHHEAQAYCAWKGDGARLLTEGEFQVIAKTAIDRPFDLPWSEHFNINLRFGSPAPVGTLSGAGSTLGFNDVWGNVWNWLSNDYYALPGFEVHPYYRDFSEPYMDSEHATLLGGSWASSGTSASRYYRLWFRRHFYQHAGFRMARNK
jgi:5-histidylcysteine sulfoxide synthase